MWTKNNKETCHTHIKTSRNTFLLQKKKEKKDKLLYTIISIKWHHAENANKLRKQQKLSLRSYH